MGDWKREWENTEWRYLNGDEEWDGWGEPEGVKVMDIGAMEEKFGKTKVSRAGEFYRRIQALEVELDDFKQITDGIWERIRKLEETVILLPKDLTLKRVMDAVPPFADVSENRGDERNGNGEPKSE